MFYKIHLRSHKKIQILREIASQFIACFIFLRTKPREWNSISNYLIIFVSPCSFLTLLTQTTIGESIFICLCRYSQTCYVITRPPLLFMTFKSLVKHVHQVDNFLHFHFYGLFIKSINRHWEKGYQL